MSILVIKSGTTSISGGTVKGDFTYFSATTRALGGTIDTGFWSGVDPTCDGYTVYKIGGQHGWAAMVATGREQLNYYLKLFGGTGTTTDENVTWATNANNIFIHSGSTGPCPYPFFVYIGYSNSQACSHSATTNITVYASTPYLGTGVVLYYDDTLTTPFPAQAYGGYLDYSGTVYTATGSTITDNGTPCSVTPTPTTTPTTTPTSTSGSVTPTPTLTPTSTGGPAINYITRLYNNSCEILGSGLVISNSGPLNIGYFYRTNELPGEIVELLSFTSTYPDYFTNITGLGYANCPDVPPL
jgi:hypothetical protein